MPYGLGLENENEKCKKDSINVRVAGVARRDCDVGRRGFRCIYCSPSVRRKKALAGEEEMRHACSVRHRARGIVMLVSPVSLTGKTKKKGGKKGRLSTATVRRSELQYPLLERSTVRSF